MKPILFNTSMVQAILDERKTVTRRIIKNIPEGTHRIERDNGKWIACYGKYDNGAFYDYEKPIRPQPYKTGDILYVRETWHKYSKRVGRGEACRLETFYGYKASVQNSEDAAEKWKPSIHMPKEAARIWLKIVDVRAERLQNMRPVDVINEGAYEDCWDCLDACGESGFQCCYQKEDECSQCDSVMMEWERLWNSTIKKTDHDSYSWAANPWVWVIEFEQCGKPEESG